MADIVTGQLEMPKVPEVLIETFTDDQLAKLMAAPDRRSWFGVRDRAIMLMLFDTMGRVSEIAGLREKDVNLNDRLIRVTWERFDRRCSRAALNAGAEAYLMRVPDRGGP